MKRVPRCENVPFDSLFPAVSPDEVRLLLLSTRKPDALSQGLVILVT
jgi:hypothetical protein